MKLYLWTLKLEFHRTFPYQEIHSSFEFLSIHLKMYELGFPWWLCGKEFTCQCRNSVQFSHSVMSDSWRPHEPQHARPPCPSPAPRVHPNLSLWLSHCQSVSQFSQSDPTLCIPMNHSKPGFPVHHQLPEFTQTHVHRVSDAI